MTAPEAGADIPDKAGDWFVWLTQHDGLWTTVLVAAILILLIRSAALLDVLRQWHKDCGDRKLEEQRWEHEKHEKNTRLLADLRLAQARLNKGVDNTPYASEQGDDHDE